MKKGNKLKKGMYGYIDSYRRKLLLWLTIVIIVALGIFVIGLILNDFSKSNIFTIIAMLFSLPGAKILVSYIIVFSYKKVSKDDYKKIKEISKDYKAQLYDLVLTSPEKVMYINALGIMEKKYIILSVRNNKKSDKNDIEHIKKYVGKHMANYDFEKEMIIVSTVEEYIEILRAEGYEKNSIDDIVRILCILHV